MIKSNRLVSGEGREGFSNAAPALPVMLRDAPVPTSNALGKCAAILRARNIKLWGKLRARQLGGIKFRRQAPIGKYIMDFVS